MVHSIKYNPGLNLPIQEDKNTILADIFGLFEENQLFQQKMARKESASVLFISINVIKELQNFMKINRLNSNFQIKNRIGNQCLILAAFKGQKTEGGSDQFSLR